MVVEERSETPAPQEVHHTIYSVANLITVLRLLLVPFFFAVLVDGDSERSRLVAFIIYAIAGSTDWIDGQIARRTNTVTQLGKIIDPLVDRLLLASGVVGLYLIGVLPLWIPIVLVCRDLYLLYGSYVLERHKILLPVSYVGKVTTAVLLVGFSLLIAGWPTAAGLGVSSVMWLPGLGDQAAPIGIWFVYVGMVLSLSAAANYTLAAYRALAAARSHG